MVLGQYEKSKRLETQKLVWSTIFSGQDLGKKEFCAKHKIPLSLMTLALIKISKDLREWPTHHSRNASKGRTPMWSLPYIRAKTTRNSKIHKTIQKYTQMRAPQWRPQFKTKNQNYTQEEDSIGESTFYIKNQNYTQGIIHGPRFMLKAKKLICKNQHKTQPGN